MTRNCKFYKDPNKFSTYWGGGVRIDNFVVCILVCIPTLKKNTVPKPCVMGYSASIDTIEQN